MYYNFNNFPLTRQRLKRLSFLVCSSSWENIRFRFRFRQCTEPNPCDVKSKGIRIAIDANHQCLSFSLVWINPGSYLFSFLMPKVLIAPNSLIWLVRRDLTPVLNCRITIVEIWSDLLKLMHVTPRGGRQLPSRWLKLNNLHSHVDLIRNSNDSNVYTDN